jgi:hypothetical protein
MGFRERRQGRREERRENREERRDTRDERMQNRLARYGHDETSDIVQRRLARRDRRQDRQDARVAERQGRQDDRADELGKFGDWAEDKWNDVTGVTAAQAAADAQRAAIDAALAASGYGGGDGGDGSGGGLPSDTLDPWVGSGANAFGAQADLLGLNGADAQAAAIASLESGPMFTSMMSQGENAILQNASATGGLRGGNTQGALGVLGPQVLNSVIQNQLGNLGGMSQQGLGAAGTAAGLDAQNLAMIQQLLLSQGDVNASEDLAGYQGPFDFIKELLGLGAGIAAGL